MNLLNTRIIRQFTRCFVSESTAPYLQAFFFLGCGGFKIGVMVHKVPKNNVAVLSVFACIKDMMVPHLVCHYAGDDLRFRLTKPQFQKLFVLFNSLLDVCCTHVLVPAQAGDDAVKVQVLNVLLKLCHVVISPLQVVVSLYKMAHWGGDIYPPLGVGRA